MSKNHFQERDVDVVVYLINLLHLKKFSKMILICLDRLKLNQLGILNNSVEYLLEIRFLLADAYKQENEPHKAEIEYKKIFNQIFSNEIDFSSTKLNPVISNTAECYVTVHRDWAKAKILYEKLFQVCDETEDGYLNDWALYIMDKLCTGIVSFGSIFYCKRFCVEMS